jgi:hypothetical protein
MLRDPYCRIKTGRPCGAPIVPWVGPLPGLGHPWHSLRDTSPWPRALFRSARRAAMASIAPLLPNLT